MTVLTVTQVQPPLSMLQYQQPEPIGPHSERERQIEQRQSYAPSAVEQYPLSSAHTHSRTTSGAAMSTQQSSQPHSHRISSSQFSFAASTTAQSGMPRAPVLQTATTSLSAIPRRSGSSHSSVSSSPTSYVALMRKQKATVWCDRSQSTDPRILAQQRAAKQRAVREVSGSNAPTTGRASTLNSGGVVGKIRHGGVPKATSYIPANLSGAGVPMRLSANEMLQDDEENGSSLEQNNAMIYARTGSSRSSTNSAKYRSGYPRQDQGRFTPPSAESGSPAGGIPEESQTQQFHSAEKQQNHDTEDSFGSLGEMQAPSAAQLAEEQAKKAEELRRRGSVDERAMSMGTGVRLFVANPDVED